MVGVLHTINGGGSNGVEIERRGIVHAYVFVCVCLCVCALLRTCTDAEKEPRSTAEAALAQRSSDEALGMYVRVCMRVRVCLWACARTHVDAETHEQ